MKRTVRALPLVIILIAVTVAPALAGFTWCISDPHLKLPGNGGVVNIAVGVPKECRDQEISLTITAVEGARLVGSDGPLNLKMTLNIGEPGSIVAEVKAPPSCPVMLSAKYRGEDLGADEFEGTGTITWKH